MHTRIWVDADACLNPIKEILLRAAERLKITLTLVANKPLRTPPSAYVNALQVAAGFDVADDRIVDQVTAGDLVITADIPLAAAVIGQGGRVLDPRGETYDENNIESRLAMRKFMEELRASGVDTGGPPPFSQTDRQALPASSTGCWHRKSLPNLLPNLRRRAHNYIPPAQRISHWPNQTINSKSVRKSWQKRRRKKKNACASWATSPQNRNPIRQPLPPRRQPRAKRRNCTRRASTQWPSPKPS